MVQVVLNGVGGHAINGKQASLSSDDGNSFAKSKHSSSNSGNTTSNDIGVSKKAVGTGKEGEEGGNAPRKLTKNEKRRQKNKQKKAQAVEGTVMDKSMIESNGVAVASWPPPAPVDEQPGVQVNARPL